MIQMLNRTPKEHGVKTCPHNGAHTHGAGFTRGIEIVMSCNLPKRNSLALQVCGEVDDCSNLAMKNGIDGTMIASFGNDLVSLAVDDQSAKRYTTRAFFSALSEVVAGHNTPKLYGDSPS